MVHKRTKMANYGKCELWQIEIWTVLVDEILFAAVVVKQTKCNISNLYCTFI